MKTLAALTLMTCFITISAHAEALKPTMIDPDITQANVQSTLCQPGYTKYVLREETGEMIKIKKQMMAAAGLDYKTEKKNWQLDHKLPLILGGAATHPDNLVLQRLNGEGGAKHKDRIEKKLGRMVCDDEISLDQARREIVENWQAAAAKYLKPRRTKRISASDPKLELLAQDQITRLSPSRRA